MNNPAKVARRNLANLLATSLLIPCAALAATLPVGPGQTYTTIQSAIAAASPGDTVLIDPGVYNENIDFLGKAIKVTSSTSNPALTILDGQYKGPAVQFIHGETRAAILSNLTIRNGGNFESITNGHQILAEGGISIYGSAPTILNNVLTGNRCWSVQMDAAAPLVQGNNISATLDPQGQCLAAGGTAVSIGRNMLGPSGKYDQPAVILGNTIEKNVESGFEVFAISGGAAIAVSGGSPLIENNILRNNASPGGYGGAILVDSGTGTSIVQNLIYGNSAGCGGGGLAINSYPGSLFATFVANNTIIDNDGTTTGHASNCASISQFYPSPDSYGESDPTVVFVNNIFSGAAVFPAIDCTRFFAPSEASQPLFDHNLFFDASGTIFGPRCIDVSTKYGNIVANPQFVDAQHNNYRLKVGSPAVDTGLASAIESIKELSGTVLSTDFDGAPRVQDATGKGTPFIDMGAYEMAGVVDGTPTYIVLTSSAYSGPAGSKYTLTATLTSALGVPTGLVTFYLDGQAVSSATVTGAGTATWPGVSLTPGFHSLYAVYGGQGLFPAATSVNIAIVVGAYDTTLKIASSANPSVVGQPVTFTVTSTSSDPTHSPSPVTLTDTATGTLLATLTFPSSSTATFTTSSLSVGTHTIEANYAGSTAYLPDSVSLDQTVTAGKPTGTTLKSSQTPSAAGQSVTFTAQVKAINPPDGTPAGAVVFSDSGQVLATMNLNTTATASFTTSSLTSGPHSITATYQPTGGFGGSSAQLVQQVTTVPSSALLTASPASIAYGDTVTLSVQISNSAGATPTGTVVFTDGSKQLGTGVLINGVATLPVSTLSSGNHTLTCTYSGDSTYGTASCNVVVVTVSPASTALSLSAAQNPSYALAATSYTAKLTLGGHPAGPGYTVTLTALPSGGTVTSITDSTGSASFTETFAAGTYGLTATVTGSPTIQSASATLTERVQANPTASTLSSSSSTAAQGQAVSLSTLVTSLATAASPVGTVSVFDGATLLGTVTLIKASANSSSATFTTSSLSVGSHTLSAVYTPGSADFAAGTTENISETISISDFSIHADAGTVSVQTGHHISFPVTVTSLGAFAGAVSLSCGTSSEATYISCALPANTQLTANGSSTIQVSIETDQIPGFLAVNAPPGSSPVIGGKLLALGLLPLFFYRSRKRLPSFMLALVMLVTIGISGCTGKYPGHTPPGTYTIFVQGVGGASQQHTVSLSLVVTP